MQPGSPAPRREMAGINPQPVIERELRELDEETWFPPKTEDVAIRARRYQ
jgi:hypothetical protein